MLLPGGRYCRDGVTARKVLLSEGCYCRDGVTAGRVSLPGGCYCRGGVTARRVLLPGGCFCREGGTAGRVLLPGGCYCQDDVHSWPIGETWLNPNVKLEQDYKHGMSMEPHLFLFLFNKHFSHTSA